MLAMYAAGGGAKPGRYHLGDAGAADDVAPLQDTDRSPARAQEARGDQTVVPAADDDGRRKRPGRPESAISHDRVVFVHRPEELSIREALERQRADVQARRSVQDQLRDEGGPVTGASLKPCPEKP